MDETFEKRVRAAAAAACWTVLIGFIFLIVQWILYLIFTSMQPRWFLYFEGPVMSWALIRTAWFWGIAGFKAVLLVLALVALWLTLWGRQLRKGVR